MYLLDPKASYEVDLAAMLASAALPRPFILQNRLYQQITLPGGYFLNEWACPPLALMSQCERMIRISYVYTSYEVHTYIQSMHIYMHLPFTPEDHLPRRGVHVFTTQRERRKKHSTLTKASSGPPLRQKRRQEGGGGVSERING